MKNIKMSIDELLEAEASTAFMMEPADNLLNINLTITDSNGNTLEDSYKIVDTMKELVKHRRYLQYIESKYSDTNKKVMDLLSDNNLTISTAESCTGGMICSKLTDIPGASDIVVGSIVSYMTRIKEDFLNVPNEIIEKFGVVSGTVASLMAVGVRDKFNSDVSLSVTGYIDDIAYYSIIVKENQYDGHIQLTPNERNKNKEIITEDIFKKLIELLDD